MTRPLSATPRRLVVLVCLPLLALAGSPGRAEAATGPFDDLDAIDVALEIGAPLDLHGSTAPELFAGDQVRLNRFRSSLTRSVGAELESCGILWDEGALDQVSISVFGRPERQPQGPPQYVYLVSVEVLGTSRAGGGTAAPERVPLRSVIGVAGDGGVEAAITEAAIAIISDELGSCDQ